MKVSNLVMARICSEGIAPVAVAQEGESVANGPLDSFLLRHVRLAVLEVEDLALDHRLREGRHDLALKSATARHVQVNAWL